MMLLENLKLLINELLPEPVHFNLQIRRAQKIAPLRKGRLTMFPGELMDLFQTNPDPQIVHELFAIEARKIYQSQDQPDKTEAGKEHQGNKLLIMAWTNLTEVSQEKISQVLPKLREGWDNFYQQRPEAFYWWGGYLDRFLAQAQDNLKSTFNIRNRDCLPGLLSLRLDCNAENPYGQVQVVESFLEDFNATYIPLNSMSLNAAVGCCEILADCLLLSESLGPAILTWFEQTKLSISNKEGPNRKIVTEETKEARHRIDALYDQIPEYLFAMTQA